MVGIEGSKRNLRIVKIDKRPTKNYEIPEGQIADINSNEETALPESEMIYIFNAVTRLIDILKERQQRGLSPVIEQDNMTLLMAGLKSFKESIESRKINLLEDGLKSIRLGLNPLGNSRAPRVVKEEETSLTGIMHALKSVEDSLLIAASKVPTEISFVLRLQNLATLVQSKRLLMNSKRSLLRSYSDQTRY